jgi:RimJ/RimL family protein N-acetyltransferase
LAAQEEKGRAVDPLPILRDFPHSFDTRRLTVRRAEPGDGPEVNAAIRETWDDLHEWMPWATRRPTIEESEAYVRRAHAKFVEREDLTFLVFEKGGAAVVGACGLHRMDWNVPSFEIGYWVRAQFQKRGFATEAAEALADFAVRELRARRLVIKCDAENERSAAVPRRIGFVHEATLKNDKRHHLSGELRDTLVFARVIADPPSASRR